MENIEIVGKLYNNPMLVAFDKEAVYLGVEEKVEEQGVKIL